jgi:predicted DNA-binding transcriptional regulator YafY
MAYSIQQLAERWQTSPRTIRRMIGSGKLTTFHIGTGGKRNAVRIHAESVLAIEQSGPKQTVAPKRKTLTASRRWV